jgi:hypothetical protein
MGRVVVGFERVGGVDVAIFALQEALRLCCVSSQPHCAITSGENFAFPHNQLQLIDLDS